MFIEVISDTDEKRFVNLEFVKEFYVEKNGRDNTFKISLQMSDNKIRTISLSETEEGLLKFYEVVNIFGKVVK